MKVLADWWRRSGLLGADGLVDRAEVVRRITAVGDSGEGLGLAWATDCSVGVFVQLYALATVLPPITHNAGAYKATKVHRARAARAPRAVRASWSCLSTLLRPSCACAPPVARARPARRAPRRCCPCC